MHRRGVPDPGRLIALRLAPEAMPDPVPPLPRIGSHQLLFPELAFLTSVT
jgi:hypothetical protein